MAIKSSPQGSCFKTANETVESRGAKACGTGSKSFLIRTTHYGFNYYHYSTSNVIGDLTQRSCGGIFIVTYLGRNLGDILLLSLTTVQINPYVSVDVSFSKE